MIKINTISNNKDWLLYLENPSNFIESESKKLNKNIKKYKKKSIHLTLLLSGNKEIKKLNNQFRGKNKSTDVLSFPFYNKRELKKKLKNEKEIYLGDIIVNLQKVKKKNNKNEFKFEFNKLWIHGLVHLFGHDHKMDKDFYIMSKVEKKYLSYLYK